MKPSHLAAVLAFILGVFWSMPNVAETKEKKPKKSFALPTHVSLRPFQAPTNSRYIQMAPITVFLEALDKAKIGEICRYQPRVMDAIMVELYRKPLKIKGRSLDLTGVADSWLLPINQSLGNNLVKSVYVVAGARSSKKGPSSRLPFNASGCTGIKGLEKKTQGKKH